MKMTKPQELKAKAELAMTYDIAEYLEPFPAYEEFIKRINDYELGDECVRMHQKLVNLRNLLINQQRHNANANPYEAVKVMLESCCGQT